MKKNKVIFLGLGNTINRKSLNIKYLSPNHLNMHLDLDHLSKYTFKKIKMKFQALARIKLKVNLKIKKEDK